MALPKITYVTKSNTTPFTNRPQQATAEDFNEIKTIVNNAIDELEPVPTVVAAATYTVLATDKKLHVTYAAIGACVITIPTALVTSKFEILIKDGAGNANINNITIVGQGGELIDGSASWLIDGSYDWIRLYSDGSNLFIIS